MSLDLVVDVLRCPLCRQSVDLDGRVLTCLGGHQFDVARQGYVNLLGQSQPVNADTASMVDDRRAFLDGGHYDPVLAAVPLRRGVDVVLDSGAGPGVQLAALLDRVPTARGLAVDVSVAACRRAARCHRRAGAIVADVWAELPVKDAVVDVVTVVFAPRQIAEFARVLRAGGQLITVTPGPEHLKALVDRLGLLGVPTTKLDRLRRDTAPWFDPGQVVAVRYELQLSPADIHRLVMMGPNAFHTDRAGLAGRVAELGPQTVEVSCVVSEWVRRR